MSLRIGVDGGGTKTACIAVDADGRRVGRHVGPGCNPSIEGADGARQRLAAAIAALRAERPGPVTATLLCMAGAPEFWQETAAALTDLGHVVAVPDSLPVLEAGTEGGPGLVLHAGTGSFVAARTPETDPADLMVGAHYAGGLGWRVGDPGSGHDIGRRAAERGLLELQGWAEPTVLGDILRRHTGLASADAIIRHLYRDAAAASDFTSLAPAILEAAVENETNAQQVVLDSAEPLLDLAVAVADRLFTGGSGAHGGLSGRILTTPFVVEALSRRAPFPLFAVTDGPEEGLRRLLTRWRP